MQFNYQFHGASNVASNANSTDMKFSPDCSRPPTFFKGLLNKQIPFREAISALHFVVLSDMRYKPRDKSAYLDWAKSQEPLWVAQATGHKAELIAKVTELQKRLDVVRGNRDKVMKPFYDARKNYFDYLYKHEMDFWYVLDPVITVHPDEVFFECFSQDESTYGRLGCSLDVFKDVGEFACGTTNIDYSAALYNEFQKIRDYKDTAFEIDPGGFKVQVTNEDTYEEKKIDLPDTWVKGFLQVSSAMTLPLQRLDLHPMDVHNICHYLRRAKEKTGPRSLRFILKPGEPAVLRFEPWNIELKCPRSIFHGQEPMEMRMWGRRRLLILERLIPIAKKFTAFFLGSGMPSFFVADLGDMSFTLGLSGWTANDWSRSGNFDLMAPRGEVDSVTKDMVFQALRQNWQEPLDMLAKRLVLPKTTVESALTAYTQAGRVMYDLNKGVYRVRELSRDPLPMDALRFDNPRDRRANELVDGKFVEVTGSVSEGKAILKGTVKDKSVTHKVEVVLDGDERMVDGSCGCYYFGQNKLRKGPCEHMLALRIAHGRKNWWSRWLSN